MLWINHVKNAWLIPNKDIINSVFHSPVCLYICPTGRDGSFGRDSAWKSADPRWVLCVVTHKTLRGTLVSYLAFSSNKIMQRLVDPTTGWLKVWLTQRLVDPSTGWPNVWLIQRLVDLTSGWPNVCLTQRLVDPTTGWFNDWLTQQLVDPGGAAYLPSGR